MKKTWFGTASLLIKNEEDRILIDPFLPLKGSENHPSLLDYQKEDSILVTHGHIDHLGSIPQILRNSEATVYCSALPASTLEKKRADSDQIVIIRPGDVLNFGEITVTPLPGKHIKFDAKLIRHTFLNLRILRYFPNFLSGRDWRQENPCSRQSGTGRDDGISKICGYAHTSLSGNHKPRIDRALHHCPNRTENSTVRPF